MAKIKHAVFDAGPFIHLAEIQRLHLLALFQRLLTTREISGECHRIKRFLDALKQLEIKELSPTSKDLAKYFTERYDLQLGEATGIALCRQENMRLFFTDDLDARDVAKALGLEPHGTLAILVRSYREKRITLIEAKKAVDDLYQRSSLFFTKDLSDWTIQQLDKFRS